MSVVTTYKPIGCDSPEQIYFYMMNCLLYSRMESGFPSNDEFFDEDVNVYLAHLLTETVGGLGESGDRHHFAQDDASLFEAVRSIENPRLKYRLYKTNADHLLISLGVFGNPRSKRPNAVPYMEMRNASYIGRGKAYYSLAQSYAIETYRRFTAVADVLGKLSKGFEKYMQILSLLRIEHFNFRHQISEGELFHLECSIDRAERKEELQELYDTFLDIYSSYRKTKTPVLKRELDAVSERIRGIDPSFRFETG
jgi:hypothetical protein